MVLDENVWDEKRHFPPNLDESVPNPWHPRQNDKMLLPELTNVMSASSAQMKRIRDGSVDVGKALPSPPEYGSARAKPQYSARRRLSIVNCLLKHELTQVWVRSYPSASRVAVLGALRSQDVPVAPTTPALVDTSRHALCMFDEQCHGAGILPEREESHQRLRNKDQCWTSCILNIGFMFGNTVAKHP